MKLLKKLLLINWHYFWNDLIEFEKINFLTGRNAAGKSTLIDALQLLLLGDTSGHFFNKAANERSSRTLKGYLRGEIGDDGDAGFRYLREGRFTSYVACEFEDSVKNAAFTLGVVFDSYADGTNEHRFFVLDSALPENRFIVSRVPMEYRELRNYVYKNYKRGKFEFPETNRGYQEVLKGKLGGLKNKYFSLFKKAVPFSPITDIETFITEYVCDVKSPVDISLMQENIRHYKRLEHDADLMEARVKALEEIAEKYASWNEERQRLEIQTYIVERAQHQAAADALAALEEEIGRNNAEIARLSAEQARLSVELAERKEEKDRLTADKMSSDLYRKHRELEAEKKRLEEEIEKTRSELKKVVNNLRKYGLVWRECAGRLEGMTGTGGAGDRSTAEAEVWQDWQKLCGLGGQARKFAGMLVDASAQSLSEIDAGGFARMRECIDRFKSAAAGFEISLGRLRDDMERRRRETAQLAADLEKGIKPYAKKLLELKEEIAAELSRKYKKDVDVRVLADLLEIRDVRWSNAVEAYLHNQKFYLLVEPRYFLDALRVYDRLKFEKGFYDWGLVDTGKLAERRPSRQEGSLAEEVVTDNEYARLFVDHVMGNLIKCDKVEELREHERAITDSCMLYQNYTARQLNPERWKYPYIGRRAADEQLRLKRQEIAGLEERLALYEGWLGAVRNISGMEAMNANEAESVLQVVKQAAVLPGLEQKLKTVIEQLGALDLSWLMKLDEQIKVLEIRIRELEDRDKRMLRDRAGLEKTNEIIMRDRIPVEKNNLEQWSQAIKERFAVDWVAEKGEPRFLKELEARKGAAEVYRSFFSQVERTRNQTLKKREDLAAARSRYNGDYKMSYDINLADNAPYDRELAELRDVRLPAYKERIRAAKEKAFDQFRDDFLAKLKSNIDLVRTQIEELNAALKESSFGTDRYRFVVTPRPEYRRYYDLITDEMLMEGYNLGSQVFRDKHRDAIDELFKQIIDVDSELNADARAELEKNIKRFTDYRTYLNFDLVVTDEEERNQRLSRTLHKKSGGETQTPFYISVLASFAQLYRIRHKNEAGNTMRLIIFDEAFSKMDSERIQESLRLLRRFGLQAILSAPPEKIGDIAPLVDRNLCVIRNGDSACVRAFDSRKLSEELGYGL
ncbi:MAG: SbcC/MukB-like Walker B domain-containing protein [Peptococcaceae bacterium]|jgi:uncharacterized protein YPO0396|nr:hypothetical protein [Peptococcaceae bacterium]MDH7526427.1 SbcC/MukB-like Walker B domain-containing protein [Peptococcaceae bacterium]